MTSEAMADEKHRDDLVTTYNRQVMAWKQEMRSTISLHLSLSLSLSLSLLLLSDFVFPTKFHAQQAKEVRGQRV